MITFKAIQRSLGWRNWRRLRAVLFSIAVAITTFVSTVSNAQGYTNSTGLPHSVLLAGSDNVAFNNRFTKLLNEELAPIVGIQPYSQELSTARPGTLVIALGFGALSRVYEQSPHPPVLAVMVDEVQFSHYKDRAGPPLAAIYNDAPLLRQVLLGQTILPHANRVALLVRPGHETRYQGLVDRLKAQGVSVRFFTVANESRLIATLSRALTYGDFLLATSDDAIFNPLTIKHILLTAYRRNRIVIGPNRAFVRAGVLASTYTPLEIVIEQAANAVQTFMNEGKLPPSIYPETFAVDVNQQVARSLNIPVPPLEELTHQLNKRISEFEMEDVQ